MSSTAFLNPSEAARRLGISIKALRLYEQRGLITPKRTAAGWRATVPTRWIGLRAAALLSHALFCHLGPGLRWPR